MGKRPKLAEPNSSGISGNESILNGILSRATPRFLIRLWQIGGGGTVAIDGVKQRLSWTVLEVVPILRCSHTMNVQNFR